MRLKWNPVEKTFEAEFQDFKGDLDAVKAAGFKTSGPPDWVWYTNKIAVLENLRANRPASGLTILTDALEEYKRIKAEADAVTALMAELKAKKKALKKETPAEPELADPDFKSYGLCEESPTIHIGYVPPVWTGPTCHLCGSPVYFHELQDPPTCIWCEKVLDNPPDLF